MADAATLDAGEMLAPAGEADFSKASPIFSRSGYDGPEDVGSVWSSVTAQRLFPLSGIKPLPPETVTPITTPGALARGALAVAKGFVTQDLGFGTPAPDPMDEFRQPNYTAGLSAPNVPASEPGTPPPNPVISGIAKGAAAWSGLADLFQKNVEVAKLATDSGAREHALADSVTKHIADIKEMTGADIPNPAYGGFAEEATQDVLARIKNGENIPYGVAYADAVQKAAYQRFQNALQDLASKHQSGSPEDQRMLAAINPALSPEGYADAFTKSADFAAQAAYAKSSGYLLPWLASTAGRVEGWTRHPINALSLLPFGSGVKAASILGRMAVSGLEQAGIVGAATAMQEPGLQERRAQLGEEHGLVPALKDVGESALFGALPGVLFQGIHEIFARFGPQAGPAVTEEFLRSQRVQDFLNEARAAPGGPEADAARTASAADAAARRAREANMSNGAWIRKEIDDFLAELEAREKAARAGAAPPPGAEPPPAGSAAPEPPPSPPAGGGGLAEAKLSFENEPPPPPADGGAGGAAVLASTERNVAGRAEGAPAIPGAILNLPRTTQVTGAAIENAELDAASAPPAIPGVSPQEHLAAYEGMVQHLENPEQVAPPILPQPVPEAGPVAVPPDRAGLPEPKTEPGEVHEYDGKPILYTRFDPRTLGTDAQAFQYKGGADQAGVTNRLAGVRRWEPLAAGNVVVYERADGKRFIVDGHQRQGLATRLLAQGHPPIRFNGALLKETDGWTVADARAVAAKKNIQEGSGETLDTARMLRDRPDMWDQSLPTSSPKLKQAKGLAELSDEAWGMMLNGVVPENYASLVGQGVPDKSVQASVLGDIARANIPKVGGENQVRMIIADANALGAVKQVQTDIFGTYEATRTYLTERAKVYSAVVKLLKDDKRVFSMLDREAERIEAAGNVLVDANADQAARADQLAQILSALASRTGPVSAALNRSAEAVANGTHVQVAARAFLRDIDRLIREEGLKLQIPPAIEVPEPSPLDLDTPAGRETQTKELEADALARPAPAEPAPEPNPAPVSDLFERMAENAKRALEASGTPADMIAHEFVTKGIEPLIDRAFPKAVAPPVVTGFQTSKGSTYVLHTDGTTTRNKTLHAGHEATDVGVKPQSARTIYVDKDVASNLSGAGLTEHGGKGYRLVLRDGKATLLSWNRAAGKWGASPGSRDIPFTTTPEVGKSPVEAWKPATDVPGYEAYRGQHAGNEITSITHAEPAATEAGPEGTRQTLAPGIAPVTDADRLRAAAAKPMTGGAKALPEGGLFDETARAQPDLLDMSMAERWAAERQKILETVPHEAVLSKLVGECQI